MRSFKDLDNQDWTIEIDVGSIKRVLAETGMNLTLPHEETDGQTLAHVLISDTIKFVDMIYSLLRPQVESRNLDEQGFFRMFKPLVLKRCREEFHKEWIDFFQQAGQAPIAGVIEAAQKLYTENQANATKQMQAYLPRQIEASDRLMRKQVEDVFNQVNQVLEATPNESSESSTRSPDESDSAISAS